MNYINLKVLGIVVTGIVFGGAVGLMLFPLPPQMEHTVVAKDYAARLLPTVQSRVVCPDHGFTEITCAIVYEQQGHTTVVPIRCNYRDCWPEGGR